MLNLKSSLNFQKKMKTFKQIQNFWRMNFIFAKNVNTDVNKEELFGGMKKCDMRMLDSFAISAITNQHERSI